jgi:hypothetical protein
MQQKGKVLITDQNALPGQVVIRGAYVNSGSRDAGPDPDWDMKSHSWKGRKNVARKSLEEREEEDKRKQAAQ